MSTNNEPLSLADAQIRDRQQVAKLEAEVVATQQGKTRRVDGGPLSHDAALMLYLKGTESEAALDAAKEAHKAHEQKDYEREHIQDDLVVHHDHNAEVLDGQYLHLAHPPQEG